MKTINTLFSSYNALTQFLDSNTFIKESQTLLIQIFSGNCDTIFLKELANFLSNTLPQASIIGATTDGEIINSEVMTKSCVLSFSSFEKSTIRISSERLLNDITSYECGATLANRLYTSKTKLCICFADGLQTNGEELLKGFTSVNKDIIIAGGLAGDNAAFKNTYLFCNDDVLDNAVVAVTIDSDVLQVNHHYNFSWSPIGKAFKVTKADKNRVYKIENETPYDLYAKYLGNSVAQKLPYIGIEFPLILETNGISYARAVLQKHDDGSLTFAGNIEENSAIRLGIGNAGVITQASRKIFDTIADTYTPEALFIYSCMARRRFLGSKAASDTNYFSQLAPLSGFFTYGEFYNTNKETLFFNETMTLLSLTENPQVLKPVDQREITETDSDNLTTLNALSHLINKTSQELELLNTKLKSTINEQTKELQETNEALQKKLYYDETTKLWNRHALFKELDHIDKPSILLVDIKGFSSINDLYGEKTGNQLLYIFGQFLLNQTGDDIKVFRWTGDQFILLSDEYCEDYVCETRLNRLISKLNNHIYKISMQGYELDIPLTITAGLASFKDDKLHLLEHADMALNHAKSNHLDICIYSKKLNIEEKIDNDLKITQIVKEALAIGNVVPFFQPIVKSDLPTTYEALVRIYYKEKLLNPGEFLEIIKHTNLYEQLTKTVIEKSFKIFASPEFEHHKLSINFTFDDIRNEETVHFLALKIFEYNLANRLIIEIVESDSVKDFHLMNSFAAKMKEFGVKIAIDDFGSGYCNFSYLLKINPDIIKIDGSIIQNIDEDDKSLAIAQTISEFAQRMNITTVAEFVSSKSILTKVKALGIQGFQGYYIGKPSPTPEQM